MIQRFPLFSYLLMAILICTSLVFGLIIYYNEQNSLKTLTAIQEEKYTALIRVSAEEMNQYLQSVEEDVRQLLLYFDKYVPENSEEMAEVIEQSLQSHPTIFGMEITYTEKGARTLSESVSPVVYGWRSEDTIHTKTDKDVKTVYQKEWYIETVHAKKGGWSEPYFDPVPRKSMVTYSLPLLDDEGDVIAVFGADLTLDWIEPCLKSLPCGQKGYPLLLSRKGMFIDCLKEEWKMRETLESIQKDLPSEEKNILYDIIQDLKKTSGFIRYQWKGEYIRFYHQTLPHTGWAIACHIPEKEVKDIISQMTISSIILGGIGLVLLAILAWGIARSVAHPIRTLSDAADELARGAFETKLPVSKGKSEIARLIRSFDLMRTDLKRYIRDVTEAARSKERINSELKLAHSIQLGMVPKNFDPPKPFGIDVFAQMEPALSVGGDLYDFAMLDDDHFYFCVGDVSGKGVPASLFMAVGKALIKSTMLALRNPAEVFTRVHEELMAHNQERLFITAICGILDIKTGIIQYANAGHTPPILITPEGEAAYPKIESGFPLALIEETEYKNKTLQLVPNGTMFLYTDGATDAESVNSERFGSKQLLETVRSAKSDIAEKTVVDVMTAIHKFAQGAKQSDDITLLAYTWHKK